MGKAQSKRSVDITTETKKGPEGNDEVTGKLEKIEDIDQKQVNGDATTQEKNDAAGEKKGAPDETENEKDLTTEKTAEEIATSSPTDGGGDQVNTTVSETSPKEDAGSAAGNAKEGEEITPLADESLNKKAKKKKWSFRSISFGKKDKQKPSKPEGSENTAAGATSNAENATAATNGDATETSKTAENAAVAEATKQDDIAPTTSAAVEVKPVDGEKTENGVAADKEQQQMNGQKTPTPTDDLEQKKPIETSTAVVNETATVVTTATTPAPASNSNDTANESHLEIKAGVDKIEAVVSNGTAEVDKNGDVHANEHNEQHEEKTIAQSDDINKSIPVDEKPHQNGTNGDDGVEEITAATKTLQIEVKTEHQIDIVNSTTNTISTTTTTIPADNFNSEQKTTTDNLLITSVQTDTNTITNTSDKSFSSNNSIAITEEQLDNHPQPVLDTVEDISQVAVDAEPAEIDTVEYNKDADVSQQQPPPLPLSAPPSEGLNFVLKENEIKNDEISSVEISTENVENTTEDEITTATLEELPVTPLKSSTAEIEVIEKIEIEIDDNLVIIDEPMKTTEQENTEEVTIELENCSFPQESKDVELIAVELIATLDVDSKNEEQKNNKSSEILDDFAAEALIIVDQIQKDLENEYDDSQQQESESDRSLNENLETKNSNTVGEQIVNTDFLTDLVSSENIFDHIKEEVAVEPTIETETNEVQIKVELGSSAPSPLSELTNEMEVPSTMTNEINQLEIELNSKNTQLSEQEDEQRKYQKIDDQANEKDEQFIETSYEENKDCPLESESIELSIDANGENKMNDDVIGLNDNDEECIVSSNKEMPTAKDLKENAAAAEITTQDLPVTCE